MKKRILKAAFLGNKPVHLILHVTNRCNLRCRTCFVDFNNLEREELTLEEIREISKHLGKLIWLDISGGEPFLRNDLDEICAVFETKSIAIPTNGSDEKLISSLTRKIKEKTKTEVTIAVSLDGFEDTNDSIRGKGTFNKAIGTVKRLREIDGIRVKVISVLSKENYNEMIDFMRFIKKLNIDFHSINIQRGISRDSQLRRPSYQELLKIRDGIFNVWKEYNYGFGLFERRILRNYQRTAYNTSLRVIKEKRQIPDCLAGKHHLVVYANGGVSSCEMLKPYGNIRKKGIAELLKSREAIEQKNLIKRKECYCYHNCNLIDNFFLNPKQWKKLAL